MKVVEIQPLDKELKKYVDCYQFFEVTEPVLVKAVPTGTLECWVKLEGAFDIFDPKEGFFKPAGLSGIFPIGGDLCVFFAPKNLRCFTIKLKPLILGLPVFKKLAAKWEDFSANQFLGDRGLEKLLSLDFSIFEQHAGVIDGILKSHSDYEELDERIESILYSMATFENQQLNVSAIASENNLTVKSLERLVKKTFGITPKRLISILRFGNSIKYLNETENHRFIDALRFGYYDQSHFIKECNKMTGLNPKEFMSKLWSGTSDLVSQDL